MYNIVTGLKPNFEERSKKMKKLISTILCAAMIISGATLLCSCSNEKEPEITTEQAAATTQAPSATTTKKPEVTTDPVTPPTDTPTPTVNAELITAEQEWHYKVFACPYSSTGPNGVYDEDRDEFEAFFRDHSWDHDAATLPEGLIDEMKAWPTAAAPFGDADSSVTHSDIGWSGDNHGLIVYTTFNIENLEEFKKTYNFLEIYTWFDNSPTFYLNGKLFFRMDTNVTANPADWVDSQVILELDEGELHADWTPDGINGNADVMDLLVEGENTFVAILKDAWGGRELQLEMSGSTLD